MLFYTVGQSYVFLAALAAGIAIGVWYDFLRLARKILAAGKWLSLAADLAFGLGAGAIAIACVYLAAYGELRFYSILGMVCGCVLYFSTVSRLLRRALGALTRFARARIPKK